MTKLLGLRHQVTLSHRDSPPHLTGKSVFGVPKLELPEELSAVSKPLYEHELPETLHIVPYHSDLIPGSFAFRHINQMAAKTRIIKALELGFNHLRRNKLKVEAIQSIYPIVTQIIWRHYIV